MLKMFRLNRFWLVLIAGCLIVLASWIPLRIAISRYQAPQPQAILVLGGDYNRTAFAGNLWRSTQNLDIWISDFPRYLEMHLKILEILNVPAQRIYFDGTATDTVTNFTTLVDVFQARQLHHIYLVTSTNHMPRARAIATIVLGSRGITITPADIYTAKPAESWLRILRDCGRAVLWVFTGITGAGFNTRT